METSSLVLNALVLLNEQLMNNDAFCGYTDDQDGTIRLLNELWDIYYDSQACVFPPTVESPQDLVDAWFEVFYAELEAA